MEAARDTPKQPAQDASFPIDVANRFANILVGRGRDSTDRTGRLGRAPGTERAD
jgi:hypothetical protein